MTDLQKFKDILLNQAERGIKSGDWSECEPVICKDSDTANTHVNIPSENVTFAFNSRGRFVGIFNYQEWLTWTHNTLVG